MRWHGLFVRSAFVGDGVVSSVVERDAIDDIRDRSVRSWRGATETECARVACLPPFHRGDAGQAYKSGAFGDLGRVPLRLRPIISPASEGLHQAIVFINEKLRLGACFDDPFAQLVAVNCVIFTQHLPRNGTWSL
jgi:hypothetical protein